MRTNETVLAVLAELTFAMNALASSIPGNQRGFYWLQATERLAKATALVDAAKIEDHVYSTAGRCFHCGQHREGA